MDSRMRMKCRLFLVCSTQTSFFSRTYVNTISNSILFSLIYHYLQSKKGWIQFILLWLRHIKSWEHVKGTRYYFETTKDNKNLYLISKQTCMTTAIREYQKSRFFFFFYPTHIILIFRTISQNYYYYTVFSYCTLQSSYKLTHSI